MTPFCSSRFSRGEDCRGYKDASAVWKNDTKYIYTKPGKSTESEVAYPLFRSMYEKTRAKEKGKMTLVL